jgi:4-hydroxy-tetrahydrodipicolinate reductase
VAIEFSAPDAAYGNVRRCVELGVPVVCGTTAWTGHLPDIEAICRERGGAFFYASNYSIGVNVAFELNRRLAEMMNRFAEYDASVEETHHTAKKDAPSGTAITLAEAMVTALDRKERWVSGFATREDELGVASVRRSVAPGTHIVTYESAVDTLTLTHTIKSRAGLAAGAVMAAEFLVREVAAGRGGMFSMKDLLKL